MSQSTQFAKSAQWEVALAFKEGRVLHFNGGTASLILRGGQMGMVADVITGHVTYTEGSPEPERQPLPADKRKAAELAELWDLPALKATHTVESGRDGAAREVICAFQDGRILHFNGLQASFISADASKLCSADVAAATVDMTEIDASADACDYLATYMGSQASSQSEREAFVAARAASADLEQARILSELWNVPLVDAARRDIVAPTAARARTQQPVRGI